MISFLKENGHLDAANFDRMTPLMNAVYDNNIEMVKELVDLGVDVNKQRESPLLRRRSGLGGQTALFYAVEQDYRDIALFLLNQGAIQTSTDEGLTPLHEAWSPEMAELLIERGGDVHALTRNDETPLHIASHFGVLDYVQFLVSVGLDKDAQSEYGTPLQMALVRGQLHVVDFLLEIGAAFEFSNDDEILLTWLWENITNADTTSKSGNRLKEEGVYEKVRHILISIPILITEAKNGNVHHFIEKLRQGHHFHPMQVLPNMPEEARLELTKWGTSMRADMHHLFLLFHSTHTASHLFYPSPISETLKQLVLLPRPTRSLLKFT